MRSVEVEAERLEVFASALLLVGCRKVDSACMRSFAAAGHLADAEAVQDSSSLSVRDPGVDLLVMMAASATCLVVRAKGLAGTVASLRCASAATAAACRASHVESRGGAGNQAAAYPSSHVGLVVVCLVGHPLRLPHRPRRRRHRLCLRSLPGPYARARHHSIETAQLFH